MCEFSYFWHDQCGHRIIEIRGHCPTAFFRAGMTGLLSPCAEENFYFTYIDKNGLVDPGLREWKSMSGFCKMCEIEYVMSSIIHYPTDHNIRFADELPERTKRTCVTSADPAISQHPKDPYLPSEYGQYSSPKGASSIPLTPRITPLPSPNKSNPYLPAFDLPRLKSCALDQKNFNPTASGQTALDLSVPHKLQTKTPLFAQQQPYTPGQKPVSLLANDQAVFHESGLKRVKPHDDMGAQLQEHVAESEPQPGTSSRPYIYIPPITAWTHELLGFTDTILVEDREMEPFVNLHFPFKIDVYNDLSKQYACVTQFWSYAHLNGKQWIPDPNKFWAKNHGLSLRDVLVVKAAIAQRVPHEEIWSLRFESRGMKLDSFKHYALKMEGSLDKNVEISAQPTPKPAK